MNRRDFVRIFGVAAMTVRTSSMRALTQDHVVVAGAGIMGASIAYHLTKRGAKVTLLEKEHPTAGTTQNSFAWFNAVGKSPRPYYDLNLGGMMGWRRLEVELGKEVLPIQWGGAIQWVEPIAMRESAMRATVKERSGWGYPVHMVDQDQFKTLMPTAVSGPFGAANFADLEGTVDPVAAAKALVARAKLMGATVVYPCEVTDVVLGDGKVKAVKTTQGSMDADYFVLAMGNGTPEIAAKAGLTVPLSESTGVLAHSKPFKHVIKRVVRSPLAEIKQNFDGRVVVGSTMSEGVGEKPTAERGEEYLKTAARYLPELQGIQLDFMTLGYRVMPKDGHPIIGRSSKYPNISVAAMHSGMTCSPYIGQLVSMEVLDQVDTDVLSLYRPQRFA